MSDEKPPRVAYDHAEVEPRWQRRWAELGVFAATRTPGRPKKYILDMFPYPSGAGLHVGHPEGYTATDILARYYRTKGFDVLHPMGWDAFGLPAEEHAIRTNTHPAIETRKNVATFKRQLQMLGFSYDWARELDTTDPDYVKWTQWIFLRLFHRGLAYQANAPVNWCPALGTVLGNEDVLDGKSKIGDHPVVRTPVRQWMLRITQYADRLLDDLSLLDWPKGTVVMQTDWIGRSEGAEIRFAVADHDDQISVFTTRPDTLFGATHVVLAPEHPLVAALTTDAARKSVEAYVTATARKSERDRGANKDKTGVAIGAFAVHPLTGARLPIWIADYVLGGYGTGAVMMVPGHDERDYAFARAFDLPVIEVVSPDGEPHERLDDAFTADGTAVRSGEFDGLKTADAKRAIVKKLEAIGHGKGAINYKLRDWVFSRQRYWGEPIPVYFPVDLASPGGDPRKGDAHTIRYDQPIAVAESELPIRLPDLSDFRPGQDPAGPLARVADWRFFEKDGDSCDSAGAGRQWFARETNTMPQWAGSCWYYLRFLDPKDDAEAWSQSAYDAWMPVDVYVGGGEHAVLHLLYARFWHKVLFDEGLVKDPEPFMKLVHQGMILGEDNEKMSKSRGNVINPDDVVKAHGADVLRLYEMFMGPLEAVKPWQTGQIQGVARFRDRLWVVGMRAPSNDMSDATRRLVHKTIKKVTHDVEAMAFNTAISAMMVLLNDLASHESPPREGVEALTQLVAPFAPHVAEEVWMKLGHEGSLARHPWPTFDEALCIDDEDELAVQVNGKVRGHVKLARGADEATARAAAFAADAIAPLVTGKAVKKFVYVPKKIINIVV
ncbi:MAG TPA: leucine--tRNA ligase [Byssovorax sp.]|jgi:leucyl-tRNA synthetase